MAPKPLLPMTKEWSFKSPTASQIFSLASPQYSFATTVTCIQGKFKHTQQSTYEYKNLNKIKSKPKNSIQEGTKYTSREIN